MPTAAKTIVITGASRGIGAGMAQYYAKQGLNLGLCSRNDPILPDSAQVVSHRLDVTYRPAFEAFTQAVEKRFGKIDAWINNAGVLNPIGPLRTLKINDISQHLNTNVLGVLNGTQLFVQHLHRTDQGGTLINISSGAATAGYAGWTAYCASKAAVERITECVHQEESPHGLRAFAIAPGVIDTQMQTQIRACSPDQFPMVHKFLALKEAENYNSPEFVAREILSVINQSSPTHSVIMRLPNEHAN